MRTTAFALSLVVCLVAAAPVRGEEAPSAAGAAPVRAKLPAPSPALATSFSADLVQGGKLWAGELDVAIEARKFDGKSVWKVTETAFVDAGGAELHVTASYHLAADLSLEGGSAETRHRGRKVSIFFARSGETLRVNRRIEGPDGKESEALEVALEPGALFGEASIFLFARGLAASDRKTYALPWAPILRLALAQEGEAPAVSTLEVTQVGPAKLVTPKTSHASFAVGARREALRYTVHLSPDRSSILGLKGEVEGLLDYVPRGEGGDRLEIDVEKRSATWKDAFLKFGFGYHLAQRELIEQSFHWPSMYAYETEVAKSWDESRDVDAFKEAWLDEFIANSQHRTRGETERLLSMTLGTGKLVEDTKDAVVFAAHANFGGGVQRTYHLKRVDGAWYLWRVDFE